MAVHLERTIVFGRLEIDTNDHKTCVQIWNYASGYYSRIELSIQEFGQLQDFGNTLEQLFFLFAYQNAPKIVGFDSNTKSLFECVQDAGNAELWSRADLPTNLNITKIERKAPGSWITSTDSGSILVDSGKHLFLASNLFKIYLVRNDFTSGSSTIQRIFESRKPSISTQIYSINQIIKKVCTGNDFVLLLTSAGHVYSMGTGTRGELGISPMVAQSNEPRPIEDLIDAGIQIVDISCGGWHALALTSEQDVYAWGLNADGQCGVPIDEACETSRNSLSDRYRARSLTNQSRIKVDFCHIGRRFDGCVREKDLRRRLFTSTAVDLSNEMNFNMGVPQKTFYLISH